jgi:hypothetical protein
VVEPLVEVGQRLRQLQLLLLRAGRREGGLRLEESLLEGAAPGYRRKDRLHERSWRKLGHVLREIGSPGAAAPGEVARVGVEVAGEDLEQRRLAGAVGADQPDPVGRADGEAGLPQEDLGAIGERDAAGDDEAHRGRRVNVSSDLEQARATGARHPTRRTHKENRP